MDRRTCLLGLSASLFGSKIGCAQAIDMCGVPLPSGAVGCRAGMTLNKAWEVRANQRTEVWCWAASLEMIFRANGFFVPQEEFVLALYGRLVSLPAFAGYAMTNQLNREWTDAGGRRFRVHIAGLYDFDARIAGLTNAQIVDALRTGRPLL